VFEPAAVHVTRYLLDTNIICNVVEPRPSEAPIAWMEDRDDEDLFIASRSPRCQPMPVGSVAPLDEPPAPCLM
jgi:hypothetical protein